MNDVKRFLDYNKKLKQRAAEMRKNMTPAEKKLWFQFLSDFSKTNNKVYRQRIIGHFIADFYISDFKLVIELDGSSHDTNQAHDYDVERSHFLKSQGCNILRFTNTQVHQDFQHVCDIIGESCLYKFPLIKGEKIMEDF